jgi:hypothetical protein
MECPLDNLIDVGHPAANFICWQACSSSLHSQLLQLAHVSGIWICLTEYLLGCLSLLSHTITSLLGCPSVSISSWSLEQHEPVLSNFPQWTSLPWTLVCTNWLKSMLIDDSVSNQLKPAREHILLSCRDYNDREAPRLQDAVSHCLLSSWYSRNKDCVVSLLLTQPVPHAVLLDFQWTCCSLIAVAHCA